MASGERKTGELWTQRAALIRTLGVGLVFSVLAGAYMVTLHHCSADKGLRPLVEHLQDTVAALQDASTPKDVDRISNNTETLKMQLEIGLQRLEHTLVKLDELQTTAEPISGVQKRLEDVSSSLERVHAATQPITAVEQHLKDLQAEVAGALKQSQVAPAQVGCSKPCVDVVFLYHNDDKRMFVDNGVLVAARTHLKGIRKFIVVSKSNSTFLHLMDERTEWFDEARAPFKPEDWVGKKSGRPLGWLYQQTLKYWIAQYLPGGCGNVMFVDSDTLWIRDFEVVTQQPQPGGGCKTKFKYNLSTQKTGAWDGDIVNPEYHHFVKFMTGLPKALKMTSTAINHWQLMQRDVMEAMSRALVGRTEFKNITAAMVHYGRHYDGMSEYEAYFSFAWYFYQHRLDQVHLPYVMRDPKRCNYSDDKTTKPFKDANMVYYFTCHDNYNDQDYYSNCNNLDKDCNPMSE